MDGSFIVGLITIILVNIVLSGDNAVVIALACRKLPADRQKTAIFWGSFGAIVLRILLTFIAVWLLQIPFLKIVGGLLLFYIAIDLLAGDDDADIKASTGIWGAVRTIIIADLIMSLDNVVAVAGAAGGNILLIIIGLAVSIPLIIWGSQLLMKLMEKFPIIVIIGSAILGYTAAEMILGDETISGWTENLGSFTENLLPVIGAVIVVVIGKWIDTAKSKKRKRARHSAH